MAQKVCHYRVIIEWCIKQCIYNSVVDYILEHCVVQTSPASWDKLSESLILTRSVSFCFSYELNRFHSAAWSSLIVRRVHGCRLSATELFRSPMPLSGTNYRATSRLPYRLLEGVFCSGLFICCFSVLHYMPSDTQSLLLLTSCTEFLMRYDRFIGQFSEGYVPVFLCKWEQVMSEASFFV